MKQVFIRDGDAVVEDVPAPVAGAGEVLVHASHSCISVGTEMSGVQATTEPLWKRALKRPDKVVKALNMMATRGVGETMNVVRGQLNAGLVVGYSAAGRVIGLGAGVDDLEHGQAVACAGAQAAHHAEVLRVPRNLVAAVPPGVEPREACTVTLGAIALQGVRRAAPTLGETFVVVGLGLIGQITAQLLQANGCRVVGIDLDRRRLDLALAAGMDVALPAGAAPPVAEVASLTAGVGADGVIVTAASSDPAVLGAAFRLCRRKGRVVLVGDVPMHIDRADVYRNEIDFFISTSYGPGRYDRRYEEEGLDYPVGYVRWTENRNMQAYLALLAQGRVRPGALIEAEYPVAEAPAAYRSLRAAGDGPRPLAVVLSYPDDEESPSARALRNPTALAPAHAGALRVGLVGAGAFARSVHLPNLATMKDRYHVQAIMSRTAHLAHTTAKTQRAAVAATDFEALAGDPDIDLLLVSTRHDSHADYALRGLRAGKHVFVEKPLSLDEDGLAAIEAFYAERGDAAPVLMTGFNRRFSPAVAALREALAGRRGPMIVDYRMNAGSIPLDHWVHGPEGGGRNLGEACHVYDLFTALTGARVAGVQACAVAPREGVLASNDNFVATVRFDDGSLCTLVYTALGHGDWPKERMEVYCDGAVLALDDYRSLEGTGSARWSGTQDKGHRAELEALARCIRDGGEWPIALWEQAQATRIALAVERELCAAP